MGIKKFPVITLNNRYISICNESKLYQLCAVVKPHPVMIEKDSRVVGTKYCRHYA